MKILSNDHISNSEIMATPSTGGVARFAHIFSEELRKDGFVWIGVITEKSNETQKITIGKKASQKKDTTCWWSVFVPPTYISSHLGKIESYVHPQISLGELIKAYEDILEIEKPDIVFINGTYTFPWALMIASKNKNIPLFVQHAGIWNIEYTLQSSQFSPPALVMMKEMEKDFTIIPNKNIFLNRVSAKKFFTTVGTIQKSKCAYIPLPFDSTKNLSQKSGVSNFGKKKEITIGVVARWDKIKNHTAVLNLAKEIEAQQLSWKISSVLSFPVSIETNEFAKQYKHYIEILPPKDAKELKKFYRAMDIMILPSLFDTSPFVVLEALIEGKATLISPGVGYAETFKKYGAGSYVCNFNNPKKVVELLKKKVGTAYPKRLTDHMISLHNPDKVISQYKEVIKELIAK